MEVPDDTDLGRLVTILHRLSPRHLDHLHRVAVVLSLPAEIDANPASDLPKEWFTRLGESLQLHHLSSVEPFTKDKFEYAVVSTMQALGVPAEKLANGNPGEDVIVAGERWSLKTQADRAIRREALHISKFMELGKGRWESSDDLIALRQRMIDHMSNYERIMSLRCLTPHAPVAMEYELIEIPKSLLLASQRFPCELAEASRQVPKPGRCVVLDDQQRVLFELYFDGGTERKLQIQKIRADACIRHARWRFRRGSAE